MNLCAGRVLFLVCNILVDIPAESCQNKLIISFGSGLSMCFFMFYSNESECLK